MLDGGGAGEEGEGVVGGEKFRNAVVIIVRSVIGQAWLRGL